MLTKKNLEFQYSYLCVCKQKHSMRICCTDISQNRFQIVSPFINAILPCYFNGKHCIINNVRCQSGQRLTTRTTDANQHCMTTGLFEYSANSRQMFNGKTEQDQSHRLFRHVIKFDQIRFNNQSKLFQIGHFKIVPSVSLGICEITVHKLAHITFFQL